MSESAQVARARLSTTRQYAGVLWAESAEEQVLKQSQTCGTILDCCALGFLLISWSEFCFHLKQIVDGFTRGDCFCDIEDGGAVDGGGCFFVMWGSHTFSVGLRCSFEHVCTSSCSLVRTRTSQVNKSSMLYCMQYKMFCNRFRGLRTSRGTVLGPNSKCLEARTKRSRPALPL